MHTENLKTIWILDNFVGGVLAAPIFNKEKTKKIWVEKMKKIMS